jgi:putative OPT family oligopeptide transporter
MQGRLPVAVSDPDPVVPAEISLPEITPRAVVLATVLASVLAGANAYMGLFAGTTLSASVPAAVLSMGIMRLVRGANILENNLVQTSASAGEALAGGVIFTIPALVMLGAWQEFSYFETAAVAALGGTIGVLFTIPLRRALVVESALKFPEGVATAEVLKVGDRGGVEVHFIAWAAAVGSLYKLAEVALRLWGSAVRVAGRAGDGVLYFGCNLSPALVAVGYILGLRAGVLVFAGGFLSWLVVGPVIAAQTEWPTYVAAGEAWDAFVVATTDPRLGRPVPAPAWAFRIWEERTRYMGVGGMAVGGLWALVALRRTLVTSIRTGIAAYRERGVAGARRRTERDIPTVWVGWALTGATVAVCALAWVVTGSLWVATVMAALMMVAAFLFSAVAGYMAGLVGSANSPISGITIATILTASFLLLLLLGNGSGPAAAILIGAVVSCAAAIAGDTMQDLKAGRIVGATPFKQQLMQWLGVIAAALVLAPTLTLLRDAYGIGVPTAEHPHPLKAPQASLMAEVAKSVFRGGIPWHMVGTGVALAVAVIALDLFLQRRGSSFRTPVLAVAVGLYLPFELSVPIALGGLVGWGVTRLRPGNDRRGLLVAAGLITGEAVVGILVAIPIVAAGDPDVLALGLAPSPVLGVSLFAAVIAGFALVLSRH